eukprot:gnl/MRDRNA2_/MRDRNA2_33970_c0_seq1.p1 gnl/MRDRNA2_/MRDRNA2_33970_c0~~gnl/MRDRNA2_/MRDRNA2_33970_c0_seq1.p1  ORF type:complete len:776 (-),score=136.67 gnl/MRDRNA2_/MRDRNA2_33970_c0_seq1:197-2524(-)
MPRPQSAGASPSTPGRRGAWFKRASKVQAVKDLALAQTSALAWGSACEVDRETAIRSNCKLSVKRNLSNSPTKGRVPLFVADVASNKDQPFLTSWGPGGPGPRSKNRPKSAGAAVAWLSSLVNESGNKTVQGKAWDDGDRSESQATVAAATPRHKTDSCVGSRVQAKFGKLWKPVAFVPGEHSLFQQQLLGVVRAAGRCANSMLSDTEGEFFRRSYGIDPQKLTHFLKELDQFARAINIPTTNRNYRQQYPEERLCYFFYRIPLYEQLGSGLPSLPVVGFAPQTLMLALSNFPWRFNYNGQRIKLCDCTGGQCQMPLDNRFQETDKDMAEKGHKREYIPEEQRLDPRASVVLSMLDTVGAGRRSVFQQPEQGKEAHGNERHLPSQLLRAGKSVRQRFSTMLQQLMSKLQELPEVWQPTQGAPPPTAEEWDRYMISMTTCIQIFDQDYTRFERLYLGLIDQILSLAKAPLRGMAEHSKILRNEPHGYYDPMQVAHLCQRLGLFNKNVDLGGRRLHEFDPKLLEKARRAQRMDTFPVVQDKAKELISRFDGLCQLLTDLDEHEENLRPELRDIREFREAVVALEETWDWCRHVLSQQALDFISQLIETLEELRPSLRKLVYQATAEGVDLQEHEQDAAEEALHTTLPIVIYLDEMRRDVFGQAGRAGRENGIFRSLFGCCSKTYHRLRSEIGKFDTRRFQTLFNFILHGAEMEQSMDPKQMRYFENLHRQLRETAAFSDDSFFVSEDRNERDQWLCLHSVVHKVAPHIYEFEQSDST